MFGQDLIQFAFPSLCACLYIFLDKPWQCLTPPSPPSGCPFIPGDVNGDGLVSVLDLVAITNFILGLDDLPEGSFCAADVDSNGVVDVTVSGMKGVILRICRDV